MDRRTFTFASLAVAVTPAAHGSQGEPTTAHLFTAKWNYSFQDGVLIIGLKATNRTRATITTQVYPADEVGRLMQVTAVGPPPLKLVSQEAEKWEKRQLMRVLPRPRYDDVRARHEVDFGLFHFPVPSGMAHSAFEVVAVVLTKKNGAVRFELAIPASRPAAP